jgi:serine/threonine protein kinase
VYQFTEPEGKEWAAKVFIKAIPQRQERYEVTSRSLRMARPASILSFEYQPEGILVDGEWFPVLLMEWGEGETLLDYCSDHFEDQNLDIPNEILCANWIRLMQDLQAVRIAHGDLQHGNILVGDHGRLLLVDYDGMYVPAMKGMQALELGLTAYQHPQRKESFFNPQLDNFSALVILFQLMVMNKNLWKAFHFSKVQTYATMQGSRNSDRF